ncbi:hypothetical protein O181_067575 [Austropuccinia psidii MF-1]|uniref:DUF4939 domain-containing protein n=1 Tax=Austropuccinia psidii MF-1 TaxID=1389203 RepID=A0A9Q3I684_9BASI|nr:hypothetical protein [Austropuccinia psidii MF-1]
MKAPDPFSGTQANKLRGFIQSCELIFHNDPAIFCSDRKKVLYSTSFLTGRAGKWIEPYLLNISNEDPSYLFNNWSFDTLQELIDITLELDTRYHERQKEKGSHQEKKPPVTGSNSSRPPGDSSSKRPHHKKNKKGKQFQVSKDKPHSALLDKDNKLIDSEKERTINKGLCTCFGGKNPI